MGNDTLTRNDDYHIRLRGIHEVGVPTSVLIQRDGITREYTQKDKVREAIETDRSDYQLQLLESLYSRMCGDLGLERLREDYGSRSGRATMDVKDPQIGIKHLSMAVNYALVYERYRILLDAVAKTYNAENLNGLSSLQAGDARIELRKLVEVRPDVAPMSLPEFCGLADVDTTAVIQSASQHVALKGATPS